MHGNSPSAIMRRMVRTETERYFAALAMSSKRGEIFESTWISLAAIAPCCCGKLLIVLLALLPIFENFGCGVRLAGWRAGAAHAAKFCPTMLACMWRVKLVTRPV